MERLAEPIRFDQKTCNIRAMRIRARARLSARILTVAGDYGIFHWVRSRLGASLPRSPQNPGRSDRSRMFELLELFALGLGRPGMSSLQPQPQERTASHCTSSRQRMAD